MRRRRSIRTLILCSFVMVICIVCISCERSNKTEHKMKIQFTDYGDDMRKEFTFTDYEGDLTLDYSQFYLETGCFVLELCEEDQIREEARVKSGDPSKGEIVFNGLEKDNEYTINLYAEDAYRGCIQVTW